MGLWLEDVLARGVGLEVDAYCALPAPTSSAKAALAAFSVQQLDGKKEGGTLNTHPFYSHHLPFLFICVLLLFLSRLVEATNKTFDVAFMSKAILVVLSRGDIIRDISVAVFAEITFL